MKANDENKPKKRSHRVSKKKPTIFQTFCLALALENWDGATALMELDKKKGDIQSMSQAIQLLSKKCPEPFPKIDVEFGAMLGPPDIADKREKP